MEIIKTHGKIDIKIENGISTIEIIDYYFDCKGIANKFDCARATIDYAISILEMEKKKLTEEEDGALVESVLEACGPYDKY